MDDQLNDDTTCASLDSNSRGISINSRVKLIVNFDFFVNLIVSFDSFLE